MVKGISVGLTLHRISDYTGGDMSKILALAQLADAKGVDMISVPDHICYTSDAPKDYPGGEAAFQGTVDEAWYEPLTLLAAIAAVTKRARLSTAILIAPARTAVFLAKQLATLDHISNGRAVPVFGAGWHRAEFEAQNLPFDGRFTHMEEQVEVCRALWSGGAQSYHGKYVNFDDLWSYPLPVQGRDLPIWFGLRPSERNIERIVRLADGWLPGLEPLELVHDTVVTLRRKLAENGRDPERFEVRRGIFPIMGQDGQVDLDRSLAQAKDMIAAGVTIVDAAPILLGVQYDDVEMLIDRLVALKG